MLLKRCSPQSLGLLSEDAFRRNRPIAVGVNDAEPATDFREILNDTVKAKT